MVAYTQRLCLPELTMGWSLGSGLVHVYSRMKTYEFLYYKHETFQQEKLSPISPPALIGKNLSCQFFLSCVNNCIEDVATFYTALAKIFSPKKVCDTKVARLGEIKNFYVYINIMAGLQLLHWLSVSKGRPHTRCRHSDQNREDTAHWHTGLHGNRVHVYVRE